MSRARSSAFYCETVERFLTADSNELLGALAAGNPFVLDPEQRDAWQEEIQILRASLRELNGSVYLEYLEDAATEFQIQGLELDWICMTWDAGLRLEHRRWQHHSFRGDAWQNIRKEDRKRYLLNAYRVLLTRARQGMVIFVPRGDPDDPTRQPMFYDETYEYLAGLGIPLA